MGLLYCCSSIGTVCQATDSSLGEVDRNHTTSVRAYEVMYTLYRSNAQRDTTMPTVLRPKRNLDFVLQTQEPPVSTSQGGISILSSLVVCADDIRRPTFSLPLSLRSGGKDAASVPPSARSACLPSPISTLDNDDRPGATKLP
nr:hypothetical protein CFP56_04582 [Quercus suber]